MQKTSVHYFYIYRNSGDYKKLITLWVWQMFEKKLIYSIFLNCVNKEFPILSFWCFVFIIVNVFLVNYFQMRFLSPVIHTSWVIFYFGCHGNTFLDMLHLHFSLQLNNTGGGHHINQCFLLFFAYVFNLSNILMSVCLVCCVNQYFTHRIVLDFLEL